MSLLDVILGRNDDANWKRVPEHTTNQAVLILAKSMLMDVEALKESIAGYTEESAFCRGQRYYASLVVNTLGRALDELMALADTPIGDRSTLNALALARTQLEAVGQVSINCKK